MYQTSLLSDMVQPYKCFPHVSKMSTLIYNRADRVIIKNTKIFNIMYNVFSLSRHRSCLMYDISSIKESRQPQPLSKYKIVQSIATKFWFSPDMVSFITWNYRLDIIEIFFGTYFWGTNIHLYMCSSDKAKKARVARTKTLSIKSSDSSRSALNFIPGQFY